MKNKILNILYICIITTISTLATYAQGQDEYEYDNKIKRDIPIAISNKTDMSLRFKIFAYSARGKLLQEKLIARDLTNRISVPYDTASIDIEVYND